jgi:hypothetical protein
MKGDFLVLSTLLFLSSVGILKPDSISNAIQSWLRQTGSSNGANTGQLGVVVDLHNSSRPRAVFASKTMPLTSVSYVAAAEVSQLDIGSRLKLL